MSVLDKFMDKIRLTDDDYDDEYYDDEYLDDEYEYEDEPKRSGSFFKRSSVNDSVQKDESFADEPVEEKKAFFARERKSTVSPIRSKSLLPNMEVCVMKPVKLDDSREIITTLLAGRTVILNMEGIDLEISQRIIDFTSGAAFAIDGRLQKISSYIFLITPPNVEITGDLSDLFSNGAIDSSAVSRF